MNTTGLQYFLTVAEEMNFSRAAQRLFISQQSLSGHIQRLEKYFGVQLFERRPVLKLTAAGEQMRLYAEYILRAEQQMTSRLADLSRENTGKLSFGCSRSRAELFLPEVWEKYHRLFPNIDLSVVDGIAAEFDQMLHSGKIDLYVGVDPPDSFDTLYTELSEERQYCIMTLSFLKRQMPDQWLPFLSRARREGVDLEDLWDFPFILLTPSNRFRASLDRYFSSRGIVPRVVFESNLHSLIYTFCNRSYGVGLISQMYLYQPLLRSGERPRDLLLLPLKNDLGPHRIKLIYRRDKQLPRYVQAFADTIRETFFEYNHAIVSIISNIQQDLPV